MSGYDISDGYTHWPDCWKTHEKCKRPMVVIGIDPGTNTGWSVRYDNGVHDSGTWNLKGGRHEGGGMRFLRLRKLLIELLDSVNPEFIAYEEVRAHMGVDAAHIYGGVIAVISEECEKRKVPYVGIPVGTVKKFACGKGNANKDMMVLAAKKKWDLYLGEDEADARWIAETAYAENCNKGRPEKSS